MANTIPNYPHCSNQALSHPKIYSSQYATQCADAAPVAEKASDSDIDLFASDDDDVPAKVCRLARVACPLEKFYLKLKFRDTKQTKGNLKIPAA